MNTPCVICGDLIESNVPNNWHPSKLARRAEWDMQAHLKTHSFAEVLRYELRQDLDQVPEEDRATIVRDVYRELLGVWTPDGSYSLGHADSRGVFSLDEALGSVTLYRLWRSAKRCRLRDCNQH